MRRCAAGLLLVAVAACRPSDGPPSAPPNALSDQPYAAGPGSPATKVFLVAGGTDVANFAAEVLEQRTLWRRAGLAEDEIACYWARPTPAGWASDHAQYRRLATALASCREASPARIAADLRVAAEASSDFVYLYVTSHGLPSQLRALETSSHARTQRFVASLNPAERAVLEPAAIGLDAGDGPALGEPRAIVQALRGGAPPHDVAFTPRTLAPLLAAFPSTARKVVILQACFSGGFIDHHVDPTTPASAGSDALLSVPNLTVLTATASERPSFGCGSGEARTYFGGAYNKALERALRDHEPGELPWPAIYEDVVFAVEAMESIKGQRASEPGLVQTQGAGAAEATALVGSPPPARHRRRSRDGCRGAGGAGPSGTRAVPR